MKLLKNEKTENYHEIEVEYSFLWIKWKVKYRKVGGNIFRFKSPNNYYPTGVSEHIDVKDLFNVSLPVSGSVCGFCKGENWIDEGILTKPCPACGGKQTDR